MPCTCEQFHRVFGSPFFWRRAGTDRGIPLVFLPNPLMPQAIAYGSSYARRGSPCLGASAPRAAPRSTSMSRLGGAPNRRLYSRLNCEGLS